VSDGSKKKFAEHRREERGRSSVIMRGPHVVEHHTLVLRRVLRDAAQVCLRTNKKTRGHAVSPVSSAFAAVVRLLLLLPLLLSDWHTLSTLFP